MPDQTGRPVAAFDFDGTLTRGDTLLPFLVEAVGPLALGRSLLRSTGPLLRAARGGPARDRAKEALLAEVLGGLSQTDARAAALRTAERVHRRRWRPAVVERLRAHRRAGHRVVVVSASLHAWVAPAVGRLGVDEVLATRWEVDAATGCLTGRLDGPNVRAARKAELLQDHLGPGASLDHAYGDSAGDRELLALAAHPCWV